MNKLVIDAGNTKIKAGIFDENILQEIFVLEHHQVNQFQSIIRKNKIAHTILCDVGSGTGEIEKVLEGHTEVLTLDQRTNLPFSNGYGTPQTLGMDRVAAVAGALHFYSNTNCLVIDAGTCITYDMLTKEGTYIGGAISPGLQMRLNAMHRFTKKLPQLSFSEISDFVGTTTETSMLSGAFYGMLGEINETIGRYDERYDGLQVVSCGGDSALFDKRLKRNIFAAPYLVLYGLNKILSFNVK